MKWNANSLAAMLKNWDQAEKALAVSQQASGSALSENEKVLESIQGKMTRLQGTFESFSASMISNGFISSWVDGADAILTILQEVSNTIGSLPTIAGLVTGITSLYQITRGENGNRFNIARNLYERFTDWRAERRQRSGAAAGDGGINIQNLNRQRVAINDIRQGVLEYNQARVMANGTEEETARRINETVHGFQSYTQTLNGNAATVQGYIAHARQMGIATQQVELRVRAMTLALDLGRTALNMFAASMIGLAVTAAIEFLFNLVNSAENARQELIELGAEAEQEADNLVNLSNSYRALKENLDAGVGSRSEYRSAQEDIIDALDLEGQSVEELIGKYGSLHEALQGATSEKISQDISKIVDAGFAEVGSKAGFLGERYEYGGGGMYLPADHIGKVSNAFDFAQKLRGLGYDEDFIRGFMKSLPTANINSFMSDQEKYNAVARTIDIFNEQYKEAREKFGEASDEAEAWREEVNKFESSTSDATADFNKANRLIASMFGQRMFDKLDTSGVVDVKTDKDKYFSFRDDLIQSIKDDPRYNEVPGKDVELYADEVMQSLFPVMYENVEAEKVKSAEIRANIESIIQDLTFTDDDIAKMESDKIKNGNIFSWLMPGDDMDADKMDTLFKFLERKDIRKSVDKINENRDKAIDEIMSHVKDRTFTREDVENAIDLKSLSDAVGQLTEDELAFVKSELDVGKALDEIDVGSFYDEEKEAEAATIALKAAVDNLWNSDDFADAADDMRDLVEANEEITPQYIKALAEESRDLDDILNTTGMSAEYLATIFTSMAGGGIGIDLISTAMLKLNDALQGFRTEFGKVDEAVDKYEEALKVPEFDENFKSYADAYDKLVEGFETGKVGSNEFRASAELVFDHEWLRNIGTGEDGLKQIYNALQDIKIAYDDADSAGLGMIELLYNLQEQGKLVDETGRRLTNIQKIGDGMFDIGEIRAEDIYEIAKASDHLSEKGILASIEAWQMWGSLTMYNIEDVMDSIQDLNITAESMDGVQLIDESHLDSALGMLGIVGAEASKLKSDIESIGNIKIIDLSDASIGELKSVLSELGYITSNADLGKVQIDVGGILQLADDLGKSKDEADALLRKLNSIDGSELQIDGASVNLDEALAELDTDKFTFQVRAEADTTDADKSMDDLKGKIDNAIEAYETLNSKNLDKLSSQTETAASKAEELRKKLQEIASILSRISGTNLNISANVNASVSGSANAVKLANAANIGWLKTAASSMQSNVSGTSNAKLGPSLVGEEGPEIQWSRDGNGARVVGENGPEIVNLRRGDAIFNAEQTRAILRRSGTRIRGVFPSLATGTIPNYADKKASGVVIGQVNKTGATGSKPYTFSFDDGTKKDFGSNTKATNSNTKSTDKNTDKEDALQKAVEKLETAYNHQITKLDHEVFMLEKHAGSVDEMVAVYRQEQDATHEYAESLRKLGVEGNDDYFDKLLSAEESWWSIQEKIQTKILEKFDDVIDRQDKMATLYEKQRERAERTLSPEQQDTYIEYSKQYNTSLRDLAHEQAELYRSIGVDGGSEVMQRLSDMWFRGTDTLKELSEDPNLNPAFSYTDAFIENLRMLREEVHNEAEYLRSQGYEDADATIQNLKALYDQYTKIINDANGGRTGIDQYRYLLLNQIEQLKMQRQGKHEEAEYYRSLENGEELYATEILQLQIDYGDLTDSIRELENVLGEKTNEWLNRDLDMVENHLQRITDGIEKFNPLSGVGEAVKRIEELESQMKSLGVDVGKTVFGNIDTNAVGVIEWTSDALSRFGNELESLGISAQDVGGEISTVLGMSETFDGIDIAYTPILQTDGGPVLLSRSTLDAYLNSLFEKTDDGWTNEQLLSLDAEGIEVDGIRIKNIIADVGDTAQHTAEVMHFAGENGAYALALKELDEYAKSANTSVESLRSRVAALGGADPVGDSTVARMDKIVELSREMLQKTADIKKNSHEAAERIRELYGEGAYSDLIQGFQDEWSEADQKEKQIKDNVVNYLNDIVSESKSSLDAIKSTFDTFQSAADEFAENGGFISIDTYESILELGPQYMQYLTNANGELEINREKIEAVTKARLEDYALQSAMAYVERVELAIMQESNEELEDLLYNTVKATDAQWGLLDARIQANSLDEKGKEAMRHNIQAWRDLGNAAAAGIGKVAGQYKELLEGMRDDLDDVFQYVMDMMEQIVNDEIDDLEDMKDEFQDMLDLRKEALKTAKTEASFEKDVVKRMREMAKIRAKIAALESDGSDAAKAQIASLNEELYNLGVDYDETVYEHAVTAQEEALDAVYDAYEKEVDDETKALEKSIGSKQKIYDMAVDHIKNYTAENMNELYDELKEYIYKDGNILLTELEDKWGSVTKAVEQYGWTVEEALKGKTIREELERIGESQSESAYKQAESKSSSQNNVVGKSASSGGYNLSTDQADAVNRIITAMKTNSNAWHNSTDSARQNLSSLNIGLASRLKDYGITAEIGEDGVWRLPDGSRLYNLKFHSGGVVGSSLKANERMAVLEDGEIVLNEKQQSVLDRLFDAQRRLGNVLGNGASSFARYTMDAVQNFGEILSNAHLGNLSAVGATTPSISIGDTYIYGSDESTVRKHQEITRDFANRVLGFIR